MPQPARSWARPYSGSRGAKSWRSSRSRSWGSFPMLRCGMGSSRTPRWQRRRTICSRDGENLKSQRTQRYRRGRGGKSSLQGSPEKCARSCLTWPSSVRLTVLPPEKVPEQQLRRISASIKQEMLYEICEFVSRSWSDAARLTDLGPEPVPGHGNQSSHRYGDSGQTAGRCRLHGQREYGCDRQLRARGSSERIARATGGRAQRRRHHSRFVLGHSERQAL